MPETNEQSPEGVRPAAQSLIDAFKRKQKASERRDLSSTPESSGEKVEESALAKSLREAEEFERKAAASEKRAFGENLPYWKEGDE